ncbi:transmembrane protein 232 isoform X2 [Lingula anatina]|uniref:Transmembrane protein 232 isoform X1 n=1 Tax=Lingula anatina TaxID=7574 RepID=A0A1S3JDK5_LINAN|nr:transmembrane protein 232 isoform X1 [Lingula anatina]XP_013408488.1 transmembrane protein 232 isoform X2 [Lingula anatina]|eukprot:XP_013408487.1 transmembrane protein 232 isoform X1 [Lingula anatina]
MPITKVPIVHKFGIISHSQRLELQERLLKQSYLQSVASRKTALTSRNPLEVTEEFVQQYNNAKTFDEKEKLEGIASKMIERVKRRAGLRSGGIGSHVDLPIAWTELSQLAQCKGKVQEECLDVLLTSLDQAPLNKSQIPALFFLAETCLYWLRTDSVNQPYLRTGEIKLLKMGQLVFMRLFYHHMAGQLKGHVQYKSRLFTYLDGLPECQDAYNPYPNALLSLRYVIEVGKILVSDVLLDSGEIKEGDNIPTADSEELFPETTVKYDATKRGQSAHSGAISSSVHELSPTLWHALDVYRCTNQVSGGLKEALMALSHCGKGLAKENWVDGACALGILAEAAKTNLSSLKVLQSLAQGVPSRTPHTPDMHETLKDINTGAVASEDIKEESHTNVKDTQSFWSDSQDRTVYLAEGTHTHSEHSGSNTQQEILQDQELQNLEQQPQEDDGKDFEKDTRRLSKEGTQTSRKFTRESQRSKLTRDQMDTDMTGKRATFGTEEDRMSQASSVQTFTNMPYPDTPGLNGWHWEVAITYTDILSDICLHGKTSNIQKVALMGHHNDVNEMTCQTVTQHPLDSAGLLDMAYFHAPGETADGGPNDWSWRIRYGAIQGLVKLCRCCAEDKNREGLRTVAWNTLLRVRCLEKDERVLEALKVGQVDANIENLLKQHMSITPSTIGAKIAVGLSKIYLPPLPPPVDPPPQPKTSRRPQVIVPKPKPAKKEPLRTTLKEELQLATALYEPPLDFNTRTSFDLKRIVEDQWRKELHQQQEEEEAQRLKDLGEKQKQLEKEQKETEEKKALKFKKKCQVDHPKKQADGDNESDNSNQTIQNLHVNENAPVSESN